MTLDAWMKAERLDDAAVADKIGCSNITIYRIRTGRAKPSFDLIEQLIDLSEGKVDGNSFFKRALTKAAASRGGDASEAPFSFPSCCPTAAEGGRSRPPRPPRPASSSRSPPDPEASRQSSAKRSRA